MAIAKGIGVSNVDGGQGQCNGCHASVESIGGVGHVLHDNVILDVGRRFRRVRSIVRYLILVLLFVFPTGTGDGELVSDGRASVHSLAHACSTASCGGYWC